MKPTTYFQMTQYKDLSLYGSKSDMQQNDSNCLNYN